MALAMTHFAVGAALTLLLFHAVTSTCRYRTTITVLGGLWALVPDLHYVVPGRWRALIDLKRTILGDLFWFHATLDGLVQGRGSRRTAAIALAVLLAVVVAVERSDSPDPDVVGENCTDSGRR